MIESDGLWSCRFIMDWVVSGGNQRAQRGQSGGDEQSVLWVNRRSHSADSNSCFSDGETCRTGILVDDIMGLVDVDQNDSLSESCVAWIEDLVDERGL